MDGKLSNDRQDGVRVEYVGQRALLGQGLQRLGLGDEEEAGGEEEALERGLAVAELDALQVQHRLAVRQDERVERKDLEHLQRRD